RASGGRCRVWASASPPSLIPTDSRYVVGLADRRSVCQYGAMGVRVEQGQATRQQLIDVATRLFAKDGYQATSIEAVLAATGMSRGALYHHFRGKDALFEAVLEAVETDIAAGIARRAAAAKTAAAALRAGCAAWLRIAEDPVAQRIALIDAPAVLGWEKWRAGDERHAFGVLERGLAAVAAEGRVRAGLGDLPP